MEPIIVNIPRGNEYEARHNDDSLRLYQAVGELIDNSLDNGATVVELYKNGDSFKILDNGNGIKGTKEDISRILKSGSDYNKSNPGKIGQYGVGLKEATMKIGKGIHIWSKAPNCSPIEFDIPWKTLDYDKGIMVTPAQEMDIEQGTLITVFFDDDDYRDGGGSAFKNPGTTCFQLYDRIIKEGKLTIISDGEEYKPVEEPLFNTELRPEVKKNIIYDGRKFDLKIGLLHEDYMSNSGFYVYSIENQRYYLFRSTLLEETLSARDGLYISIGLHNAKLDWRIDKNKRSIGNIKTVSKYLKDYGIIDRWKQAIYNEKKDDTCEKAKEVLNEIFSQQKSYLEEEGEEVRGPVKSHPGSAESKDTGRKRKEASIIRNHPEKNVKLKKYGQTEGVDLKPVHLDNPRVYLRVNRDGDSKSFIINKNNEYINKKIENGDYETIVHLCLIAWSADAINLKRDELPYGLVDRLFYQHEYFNK